MYVFINDKEVDNITKNEGELNINNDFFNSHIFIFINIIFLFV
jgi:hypothetical protein